MNPRSIYLVVYYAIFAAILVSCGSNRTVYTSSPTRVVVVKEQPKVIVVREQPPVVVKQEPLPTPIDPAKDKGDKDRIAIEAKEAKDREEKARKEKEDKMEKPPLMGGFLCPGLDSNQHALSSTTTSKWLVYQFQHLGW